MLREAAGSKKERHTVCLPLDRLLPPPHPCLPPPRVPPAGKWPQRASPSLSTGLFICKCLSAFFPPSIAKPGAKPSLRSFVRVGFNSTSPHSGGLKRESLYFSNNSFPWTPEQDNSHSWLNGDFQSDVVSLGLDCLVHSSWLWASLLGWRWGSQFCTVLALSNEYVFT